MTRFKICKWVLQKSDIQTSMHSSRMRTARSPSMHCAGGGSAPRGVSAGRGDVCSQEGSSPKGGCLLPGGSGIPACTETDPPREKND